MGDGVNNEDDAQENRSSEDDSEYSHKKVKRRVESDEKLPFTVHLEELRWRLIYCVGTVIIVFFAVYALSEQVFQFIRKPIGTDLVFLAPAEAFFVYFKLSFFVAIIISIPMILYQAWEFVAPGLLDVERKYTGAFVVSGTIFFMIGAAFCYFLVLPYGLDFLIGYAGEGLTPMISVGNYISFVLKIVIAFGIIFEMPIVLIFGTSLGFFHPAKLKTKRGYVIVGSFVIASLLTPPDIFTQVIMAVPMILLFEFSLLVSWAFVKKPIEGEED